MRAYLDAMHKALYRGRAPEQEVPILLGALRENMLRLAAAQAQGAHPYLVPVEHTRRARAILGPAALLAPEQMVLRETHPEKARASARAHVKIYLGLPNYQTNLRELGYGDEDFAAGGSDRLIDALVAWGDTDQIRARIQAHRDAGADHVCIQALPAAPGGAPDEQLLELLAPAR
jgi:probable F420-dependent oxidoreductase